MSDWKMDPEKKRKWVEALRSGDYKQASSFLKIDCDDNNSGDFCYCCLGIYAEVVERDVDACRYRSEEGLVSYFSEGDELLKVSLIPEEVQITLTNMNDKGHSFNKIADFIEENY